MKSARLRPAAEDDLVAAARYYTEVGGLALGERLFDAAIDALVPIQRMPHMGSPRLGQICGITGLRTWRVRGFPLQWFYLVRADHLDVVRLLGERQDIAAILSDAES